MNEDRRHPGPEEPVKEPAKEPVEELGILDPRAGVAAGQSRSRDKETRPRLRKGASALPSRPGPVADRLRYRVARRLTDRDRELLRTIARLRVLTTPQIAALFFDSPKTASNRLAILNQLGLLGWFQPYRHGWGAQPFHYVLGREGAAVLAAERGDDPALAARRWRADKAFAIAHSQRLAHVVGVNDLYVGLAAHTRRSANTRLAAWLTERECATWTDRIVNPDAIGEWHEDGRTLQFFVEYDRGSENLARLAAKLDGYARLESERGQSTWVLFVFTSPRREVTARRALSTSTVPVATGVLDPSARPDQPIWLCLGQPARRVQLIELVDIPKPAEALRRAADGGLRAWRFVLPSTDAKEAPFDDT